MIPTLLFFYRRVVAQSPDEHLVTSLPGLKDGDFPSRHHAGHIPVVNGYLFYWLIESASSNQASDPLVIWLNGGPVRQGTGACLTRYSAVRQTVVPYSSVI